MPSEEGCGRIVMPFPNPSQRKKKVKLKGTLIRKYDSVGGNLDSASFD